MVLVPVVLLVLLATIAAASPLAASSPTDDFAATATVTLDAAAVTGRSDGNVDKFYGIPFAMPPTGDRRFRLPEPVLSFKGQLQATHFGHTCPQQALRPPNSKGLPVETTRFISDLVSMVGTPESEDCLTINVVRPKNVKSNTKLPVLVWIFGGGFEVGGTSIYPGESVVLRSVAMGKPVIYVSMNYRLTGFGFLASQEVKDAGVGNLGLHDQREALRWIQKYIGAFGGDHSKVTIWGESAGAISVSLHMVTNGGNTDGLFRGAFMQSGSPIPVGDITHGQKYYDAVVEDTGCKGNADTLNCLRGVEYKKLKDAIDKTPGIFDRQALSLAWLPRADGVFLKEAPQQLVKQGSVANIPFVTGDCDDEGTLFSLSSLDVTDETGFKRYIKEIFLPNASDSDLNTLLKYYPSDVTQGSPFDTGHANALTPQFKRIAAFQGDAVFQAPRRFFLQQRAGLQNTWSFLSKRFKYLPVGSAHGTDLLNVFAGGDMTDYLINFATKLDPNGGSLLSWPKYDAKMPKLLTFQDGIFFRLKITSDTYREKAMAFLTTLTLATPSLY